MGQRQISAEISYAYWMRSDGNEFSDGFRGTYMNVASTVDSDVPVKQKSPAIFFFISRIKELLNFLGKVNLSRYDFYN